MTPRRPGTPPEIPGYTPGDTIGSGGFADVFLYREDMTDRDVAVKVQAERLSGERSTQQFFAEAKLMAGLSTHPYIVTIHLSGVTGDGRPYLVMEYCSRDDLAQRIKRETLSIAEVLEIGIRVAGAVETAHRAGILHRDIKPANILTTDYGRPALTDFGIAATVNETAGVEGLSVPWSPPEALADPSNTSVASDVYSLAATVWHLLAGRSPFARTQGPNGVNDLIHRISNTVPPRTGRADVPARLERVLAAAMAKSPADRPASALAFARSLQAVENEEGYAETPIDIFEASRPRTRRVVEDGDEPGTRVRALVVVDPDGAPTSAGRTTPGTSDSHRRGGERTATQVSPSGDHQPTRARATGPTVTVSEAAVTAPDERTRSRPVAEAPPVEDTQLRPRVETEVPEGEGIGSGESRSQTRTWALALTAAVVVVAGGVATAVAIGGAGGPTPGPGPVTSSSPAGGAPAVVGVVPKPVGLAGKRQPDGSIVFTWKAPAQADRDRWLVRRADPGAAQGAQLVNAPTVRIPAVGKGKQACIQVSTVLSDGGTSDATPAVCAG